MTGQHRLVGILLVAALIVASVVSSPAQTKRISVEPADWLVDVPSSPLRLNVNPNKQYLAITNRSTARIVKFRIGCVTEKEGKFTLVARRSLENADISVNAFIAYPISNYAEDIELCMSKQSQLAVVEAMYVDGSTWLAGVDAAHCLTP